MSELTLTITEEAKNTLNEMYNYLYRIEGAFGTSSPYAADAALSLCRIMNSIIGFGGNVWSANDLELGGETSYGMVYGVIFTKAGIDEDTSLEFYEAMCAAGNIPGTWSVHS